MPPIARNILAVIGGIIIGSAVNMALVIIGPIVIPPPETVDQSSIESMRETLSELRSIDFIFPWLAHALGTLAGAFAAAKIAASHRMRFAIGVGVWFLIGGITMVAMLRGPLGFAILDLSLAYLPMAWLGGTLASGRAAPTAGSEE